MYFQWSTENLEMKEKHCTDREVRIIVCVVCTLTCVSVAVGQNSSLDRSESYLTYCHIFLSRQRKNTEPINSPSTFLYLKVSTTYNYLLFWGFFVVIHEGHDKSKTLTATGLVLFQTFDLISKV